MVLDMRRWELLLLLLLFFETGCQHGQRHKWIMRRWELLVGTYKPYSSNMPLHLDKVCLDSR